jgi:hypothetical protein
MNLVPLETLAARIREEQRQAVGHAHKEIEHAIAAGRLLLEAKAGLNHGQCWHQFGTKASAHVRVSERLR